MVCSCLKRGQIDLRQKDPDEVKPDLQAEKQKQRKKSFTRVDSARFADEK